MDTAACTHMGLTHCMLGLKVSKGQQRSFMTGSPLHSTLSKFLTMHNWRPPVVTQARSMAYSSCWRMEPCVIIVLSISIQVQHTSLHNLMYSPHLTSCWLLEIHAWYNSLSSVRFMPSGSSKVIVAGRLYSGYVDSSSVTVTSPSFIFPCNCNVHVY